MNQHHRPVNQSAPRMAICWPRAGIAQVGLEGEYDLGSADRLATLLNETLKTCSHLVVDLSSTEFIDSTIIRVLVATKGHADATNRRFSLLLGTRPIVERVLEITGVLTVLNRVHTLEEALAKTSTPLRK